MCDKVVLENGGIFRFKLDWHKNQKIYYKVANNYSHALEFTPDSFKTQEIYDKAVDTYPSVTQFIPECYKTQKMSDNQSILALALGSVPA